MKIAWVLALMVSISSPLSASMIPPRSLPLELSERVDNGMSRADFDATLDQIERVYAPLFERLGGTLSLERFWDSARIDAHSTQSRDNWIIRIYGGLARHPFMTVDGLALVVCHEIGHHLAGFPQVSSWAASEANADYYATQTCLKTIWPAGEASRSIQASQSVGSFLADLEGVTVSWDQPDPNVVTATNLSYPSVQCRFDTLMAGILCDRPSLHRLIPWNEREMAASSCHAIQNDTRGLRPRCWFRPRL